MRQRALHGPGYFRQRVERRDGVSTFYAGEIAAQQAGALFDVALRHPPLQPETSDCDPNIHAQESACIVTRVVPDGKQKFMIAPRAISHQPSAFSLQENLPPCPPLRIVIPRPSLSLVIPRPACGRRTCCSL